MALVRADVPQKYKDRSWSGFFKKETWIFGAGNKQPNHDCTWLLHGEAFRWEWGEGGIEISFLGKNNLLSLKMCLLTVVIANIQKDPLTLPKTDIKHLTTVSAGGKHRPHRMVSLGSLYHQ